MSSLYSDVIIDHFRRPRNYGSMDSPDIVYEDLNPLCGDRIRIELRVRDGIVHEARFTGDGCAISIAAASMLTELITGADVREGDAVSLEELVLALKGNIKSSRMKCVSLPLEVLRSGISNWRTA